MYSNATQFKKDPTTCVFLTTHLLLKYSKCPKKGHQCTSWPLIANIHNFLLKSTCHNKRYIFYFKTWEKSGTATSTRCLLCHSWVIEKKVEYLWHSPETWKDYLICIFNRLKNVNIFSFVQLSFKYFLFYFKDTLKAHFDKVMRFSSIRLWVTYFIYFQYLLCSFNGFFLDHLRKWIKYQIFTPKLLFRKTAIP